jgi:hypothetical protein
MLVMLQRHGIAEVLDGRIQKLCDEKERDNDAEPAPLIGRQRDDPSRGNGQDGAAGEDPAVALDDRKVPEG